MRLHDAPAGRLRKANSFTYAQGIIRVKNREFWQELLFISGLFLPFQKTSFQSSQTFQSALTAFFVPE
jgi:hypothetical protein